MAVWVLCHVFPLTGSWSAFFSFFPVSLQLSCLSPVFSSSLSCLTPQSSSKHQPLPTPQYPTLFNSNSLFYSKQQCISLQSQLLLYSNFNSIPSPYSIQVHYILIPPLQQLKTLHYIVIPPTYPFPNILTNSNGQTKCEPPFEDEKAPTGDTALHGCSRGPTFLGNVLLPSNSPSEEMG